METPPAPTESSLPRWLRTVVNAQLAVLVGLCFAASFFVGSVLPYRSWDSLAFGSWSRQIAETGHVFTGVIATNLNRPLFYLAQGYAWRWLGYHEWLGRSLSIVVSAGFVIGVWIVAAQLGRGRRGWELHRALTVGVALASSVYATYVAAGMTDVPVAAISALTAAALWSRSRPAIRLPLIGLAAAATGLSKPTGFVALAGIALATPLLVRERERRAQAIWGLAALGAGALAALAYDAIEAHRIHQSLYAFLHAGNTDYFLNQGAAQRWERIARGDWLGLAPRLLVLFGLVYGVARAAGAATKWALGLSGPVAIVWAVAGPILADGGTPYPFHGGITFGGIAFVLLAAAMLGAAFVAGDDPLDRRAYAALLVWLAPGAGLWLVFRSDEVRFLSPAWPAAVLLAGAATAVVARSLARLRPALALVPVAAVALLAVANLTSIDGLGATGWRGLRDLGWAGWSDQARVENFAYGPFSYELDLARENVGRDQTIVTSDGRLKYFFPGRVSIEYAGACSDLVGARYFALLTGGESADIAAHVTNTSADPLAWTQCVHPRATLIGEQPGIYAVYVIGGPPARPSTLDDCHLSTAAGQLLDAVFADGVSYAEARHARERAAAVGFGAHIEQTGCDSFRVVVTGVPTAAAAQADFRNESTRAGFHVKLVPALRYPEVPDDVAPVPESR
jgi:hypothetical protein